MNAPASFAADVPLDDRGRLAGDLPCVNCRYNLRGLDAAAVCPECGTAVSRSRGGWRPLVDPARCRVLRQALDLALGSIALTVGLVFFGPLAMSGFSAGVGRVPASEMAAVLAPLTMALTACWLFTRAPADASEPLHNERRLRRLSRAAGLTLAALTLIFYALSVVRPSDAAVLMQRIVFGLGLAAAIPGVFIGGAYARLVALHLQEPNLAHLTWIVAAVDALVLLNVLTGYLLYTLVELSSTPGGYAVAQTIGSTPLLGCGICATVAALFVFGVCTLALMVWFRLALNRVG